MPSQDDQTPESSDQGTYQGPQQPQGPQPSYSQQEGYVPQPPPAPVTGQPSPTTETTPLQPQAAQPGRDKSKKFISVLAVLTLIVAGFAGFYLGASGLINERFTPSPTPIPSPAAVNYLTPTVNPTPTPTPGPTAGWRVFENERFSFKYPQYLPVPVIATDEEGKEILPRTYEAFYKEEGQEVVAYSVLLSIIGPEENKEGMKLKEWLGENSRLDLGEEVIVEVTNASLSGKEAVLVSGTDKVSGALTSKRLYFELEDSIYSLGFNIEKTSTRASAYATDFDLMLETISFK